MSKNSFSRKSIKPVIDIYEDEDNKRRDSSGRKRVDVIQCLLESSSDENDDTNSINQNFNNILWLTFAEICHIRSVLAVTTRSSLMFNEDKASSKISHDQLCFRCGKRNHSLFFIPSCLSSICYICQQRICKKCSVTNFLSPSSKHVFPVRIQTLIKTSSTPIENQINKSNPQAKTICYDCSQIFNEYTKPSHCPAKTPATQSFFSSLLFSDTQNSHRSVHMFNDEIGKTTMTTTSSVTRF